MFSHALPPVTVRVSREEAPATRVGASYMVVVLAAALLFSYSVAQAQSLSAPTTLNAVTYSKNRINLAWNDRNSISSGMQEWGYIVQRAEWTPSDWGKVFTSGANVTSWSSTGLSTGTPSN